MSPPLIVIMADQLRHDLIGPHTPRINELLADSCVFPRAYCGSPLCAPARGAFFTGQYPNVNGSLINPWAPEDRAFGQVKAGTPNLYTLLEKQWDGWHTGKQHLYTEDRIDSDPASKIHWLSLQSGYAAHLKAAGKRAPGGAAFRALMPEMTSGLATSARRYSLPTTGCYEPGVEYFFDGYITATSLQAIEERDRTRPFFLSAMFLAPHPPLDIPEPWYSRVSGVDLPENVGRWSKGQSPLQMYNLTGYLGTRYSREDWQEIWRVYAGLVSLLDDCVGQLIDRLKAEGLYDDALIVFTSDHGEMLGSHRLWQKMCMYEESVRTPVAFKPPKGLPVRSQCNDLLSHVDVLPTLCDYLDVPAPNGLSGRSVRPAIEGDVPAGRDRVFIQYDGNGALGNFSRCLIAGSRKLIVDLFKDEVFFELYDLSVDPLEMHNLAFEEEQEVRTLAASLLDVMAETNDRLSFSLEDYRCFRDRYSAHCTPASAILN